VDKEKPNPLAHCSDDELVAEHTIQGANSHFLSEMMRRHKDASEVLGRRMNRWLLWFTIAIFALTGVLVWLGFKAFAAQHLVVVPDRSA